MTRLQSVLETERFLDQAEREFLTEGRTDFVFPVRRRGGYPDFYALLDRELAEQTVLKVRSLRQVKEGYAWISRPATLGLDLEALFRARPHVSVWRGEIERLNREFDFLNLGAFLRSEGTEAIADLIRLRVCLEVLYFLVSHRFEITGLLPRQMAHGQSTKLIGHDNLLLRLFSFWRGEPSGWKEFYAYFGILDKPLEFRFYAPTCRCQGHQLGNFHGLLALDWSADFEFSELTGTLIVENFESFLALTRESRSTLLVWGAGWRAVHLRALIHRFPGVVHYWGDIDKEGYEIFGALHNSFSELVPVLMDFATIDRYRGLHQRKEIFLGPYRKVAPLQREYEQVSRQGIQIEQEQMRETWPFRKDLR